MFKENFIRICTEKGLSPSNVCIEAGISKSNYSNWNETSVPRKTTLIKIAQILNVDISELVSENHFNTPYPTTPVTETPHFVAYMDFLGIKNLIEEENVSLAELFSTIYTELQNETSAFNAIEKIGFKVKFFSDNLVISVECSNEKNVQWNQIVYFFTFLSAFQYKVLKEYKILMRGGITLGNLYMDETFLIGKAIDNVYYFENNIACYPRIIVNSLLLGLQDSFPLIMDFIKRDFDGEYFIDYLKLPNKEQNQEISNIIDDLIINNAKKDSIKIPISQKLNWLKTYNNSYLYSLSQKKAEAKSLVSDLTPEEIKKVQEYIVFLKSQRKK
jgi:transcriptional regulator with XRE-family HTH domain